MTYVAIAGQTTLTLWRNAFLFNESNAFVASISSASVSSSSNIWRIPFTAASHPASWPAQSWRDPTEEMISSLMEVTNSFPAIHRKTSPTPTGRSPGYLLSGIKRLESNASRESDWFCIVHSFLMTSAMSLHKSFELDPKFFDRIILLQPSASISDGPAPPLVFVAAFRTVSTFTFSYRISWSCSGASGRSKKLFEPHLGVSTVHLYAKGTFVFLKRWYGLLIWSFCLVYDSTQLRCVLFFVREYS